MRRKRSLPVAAFLASMVCEQTTGEDAGDVHEHAAIEEDQTGVAVVDVKRECGDHATDDRPDEDFEADAEQFPPVDAIGFTAGLLALSADALILGDDPRGTVGTICPALLLWRHGGEEARFARRSRGIWSDARVRANVAPSEGCGASGVARFADCGRL